MTLYLELFFELSLLDVSEFFLEEGLEGGGERELNIDLNSFFLELKLRKYIKYF